jgi:hypothetical protein
VSQWDLGILRPGPCFRKGTLFKLAEAVSYILVRKQARRYLVAAASSTGYFYLNLQEHVWFALLSYHSDEGGRQCRTAGSPWELGRLHGSMQVGRPENTRWAPAACFDGFGSSGQQPRRWHWWSQDGDKLGPLLVKLSADTVPTWMQIKSTYTWTNVHTPSVSKKSCYGNRADQTFLTLTMFVENVCNIYISK